MVTQALFCLLVAGVAVQRLVELRVSRRNEARLLQNGGAVHAPAQLTWMTLLHTSWLVAMVVEVLLWRRPFVAPLAIVALLAFAAGQALRYAAMRALGPRWTVSIVAVPGEHVVDAGIFRLLRHPNYLGVALEIAALPLVHGAWLTALCFTVLDAAMLRWRIGAEERALAGVTDYAEVFDDRPGLLSRRRLPHA